MTTNPYESASHDRPTPQTNFGHWFRRCIAVVLLMTSPLWLVMSGIQSELLDADTINTTDMAPLVGNETGTVTDYLLNVWHWDAANFLLFLATIRNTVIAVWLLRRRPIASTLEQRIGRSSPKT